MESELEEHPDDLVPVKSVLTALGYTTKSSVASIKTAKNVSNLEKDLLQLHATFNANNPIFGEFPALVNIKSFTPGMRTIIFEIVCHLNQMVKSKSFETTENTKKKMFEQGKMVSYQTFL